MAGAAAALPQLLSEALAQGDAEPRRYGRARLVGPDGAPLKSKAIPVGQNLIFHYPFAGTPCFLLDLGRPTRPRARLRTTAARAYEWHGGTGASGGVVAYSAICAHKLTYPTREISFISYRAEKTPGSRFARVIHCCSEHSQYDPADGARVLAGPATQPLAAVLLEHDPATDRLYATGTQGGELFDRFFERFAMKLSLEHGGRERQPAGERCLVQPIENYCRQLMRCA